MPDEVDDFCADTPVEPASPSPEGEGVCWSRLRTSGRNLASSLAAEGRASLSIRVHSHLISGVAMGFVDTEWVFCERERGEEERDVGLAGSWWGRGL